MRTDRLQNPSARRRRSSGQRRWGGGRRSNHPLKPAGEDGGKPAATARPGPEGGPYAPRRGLVQRASGSEPPSAA